jgi:hypothetical protein
MIQLPQVANRIFQAKETNILIVGGRTGGKTKTASILSVLFAYSFPYTDQIYCRASYGSMADSCFAEYKDALNALPDNLGAEFQERKSPLRFERGDINKIYFMGIGGSNLDRTKGMKTSHPIKVTIMEETQELPTRTHFDQAMASLRRNFGEQAKVLVLGNPPPHKAHWFNQMVEEKKNDKDWLVVYMTWEDIVPFLNDYDLKEILKTKIKNREYYDWFYMGRPTSSLGCVYMMYNPDRHLYQQSEISWFMEKTAVRPVGCVIGVDGAVTTDCTSFVPLIILSNGQSIVGPIFHHDPTKDGQVSSGVLVQQCVQRWFDQLCKAYNLGTREDLKYNPYAKQAPILMVIDPAASDLIKNCQFYFQPRALVRPAKKDRIPVMVGYMQSAIGNDMVNVVDFGGYFSYMQNKFIKAQNPVDYQLQNLAWNDRATGYDDMLPNDDCDALTYAVNAWYGRTENMQWFNIVTSPTKLYDTLRSKKGF